VVEHPLGKGEVVSSILTGSTRKSPDYWVVRITQSGGNRIRLANSRATALSESLNSKGQLFSFVGAAAHRRTSKRCSFNVVTRSLRNDRDEEDLDGVVDDQTIDRTFYILQEFWAGKPAAASHGRHIGTPIPQRRDQNCTPIHTFRFNLKFPPSTKKLNPNLWKMFSFYGLW
jgi:hypothetical protein